MLSLGFSLSQLFSGGFLKAGLGCGSLGKGLGGSFDWASYGSAGQHVTSRGPGPSRCPWTGPGCSFTLLGATEPKDSAGTGGAFELVEIEGSVSVLVAHMDHLCCS